MKKKLTITDRISLKLILPATDSFENLIIREDLLKRINITQKEIDKYKIKTNSGGNIQWTATNDLFEYSFSDMEVRYIRGVLKDLSEKKKMHETYLGLYKSFVNS